MSWVWRSRRHSMLMWICQCVGNESREVPVSLDRVASHYLSSALTDEVVEWLDIHAPEAWEYMRVCHKHHTMVMRFYRRYGGETRHAPENTEIAFKLRFG